MGRVSQTQNIDSLIACLQAVIENQCSLSDQDLLILNEALKKLQILRNKKGKTNKELRKEVQKIVELFARYFS
ncbi:hypothetical protein [Fluviicola sp.]|jgi:predicted secreted protein|uniref:hypothetical protein n=1 Tax=Fluviicola sp. TaxID=1917219 RepID=UPI002831AEBE|nr:hypothetical protein [Fluviicola sp.]MDR0803062.1 hypothetical protein [Fluviicola sp.]